MITPQQAMDYAADIVAPPTTLRATIRRILVFIVLAIPTMWLSEWSGLRSILFLFGYAWGGLHVYSIMRPRP